MAKETDSSLQTPDVNEKKGAVQKKEADKPKKADPKAKEKKVSIFQRISRFFRDAKSEFKKIVWPDKKTVINNTIVVVVFMLVVAVAVWLLDLLFINGFNLLF